VDQPIPLDRIPTASNLNSTYFNRIKETIINENPTLGELAMRYQRGIQAHRGSATTIADTLQSWFENGACDGFMLSFATLSDGLAKFVNDVVPKLQDRGVFRREYSGTQLRDHLRLKPPANQFTAD
jgi:alkanesulfonate monooxygenase SsuD/methylene tetrahydromethanopterin reductase-like flavin-dependent oxidoreductase (luciferase family)